MNDEYIEQLLNQNAELEMEVQIQCEQVEKLQAEVERLKVRLQKAIKGTK
jgi:ubiquinone biosynthesis protein UbiJ